MVYRLVAQALTALMWVDGYDAQGNCKRLEVPDYDRRQWAAEMVAKYFGDLVTTKGTEESGIRQLVIIRPGPEAGEPRGKTKIKAVSGSLHIQPQDVSRDVVVMGNRQNHVIDISGDAIQRADTE